VEITSVALRQMIGVSLTRRTTKVEKRLGLTRTQLHGLLAEA